MAEQNHFVCDHCGKDVPADAAVNWLELKNRGLDARACDEKDVAGLYCSKGCVVAELGAKEAD